MAFDDDTEPLPVSHAELTKRLQETGLSADAIGRIVAEARPGLVLEARPTEESSIPPGASKLGGLPDLPGDMAWPMRPAYDDGGALAQQYATDAANLYADAGLLPPWMPEAQGKALLEDRKRLNDEAWAGTRQLMAEAGVEIDFDPGSIAGASPEEIEAEARSRLAMAEAAGKPFPLTFIGQFDLAALSGQEGFDRSLPDMGHLLLFYDLWISPACFEPRARAGLRLIHHEAPAAHLVRSAPPQEFGTIAGLRETVLRPAAITPRPVLTTIPIGDASWKALEPAAGDDARLYGAWLSRLGWPTAPGGGNHQLGGWPRAIQGHAQSLSQLAANGIDAGTAQAFESPDARRLLPGARDWRLVLQIGRDEAVGLALPGAFYVLMRERDLQARRFDEAWMVYEQD